MRLFLASILVAFGLAGTAVAQDTPPDTTEHLVAVEDAFVLLADSSLSVAAGVLLVNDEVSGVDSVVVVLKTPPANGSFIFQPDGAFTYTPAPGFTGTDAFTYILQTLPRQEVAMDPDRSSLLIQARVSTPIGSDEDETIVPIGGSLAFFLEPNRPPYDQIHVVKMDLSAADSIDLEFRFGGLITLGRLFVESDSGGIRIVMNEPGTPASVDSGDFVQENNKIGVLGNILLEGTGLVAGQVPDDPQVFETETELDLEGNVALGAGDALAVSLPVSVADTVTISGTDIELTLSGTVRGESSLRVPASSNEAAVTLTIDPRTSTGVDDERPVAFVLEQNYPNPFNPNTRIAYVLAASGPIRLAVYDLLGREVAVLVDSYAPAGRYEVGFDAGDLPSGMYVYRLTADGFADAKTLIVLK